MSFTGSLEYGGPKPGQLLGGRWKPLHYWYRRSIFAPVMATCGLASSRPPHDHSPPLVQCYAKNDLPLPFDGEVRVDRVHLMSGTVTQVDRRQLTMAAGAGTSEWWTLNAAVNATVEVLKVTVVEAPITGAATPAGTRAGAAVARAPPAAAKGKNRSLLCDNTLLFTTPQGLQLPAAHVTFSVGSFTPGTSRTVPILVRTNATALYVTLTSTAAGRFSDNAFLMLASESPVQVDFVPFGGGAVDAATADALQRSLRVEHAQIYST